MENHNVIELDMEYVISAVKWIATCLCIISGIVGRVVYKLYLDNKKQTRERIKRLETREDELVGVIANNSNVIEKNTQIISDM